MATIQFKCLGKKAPANLNVRFFHNTINCYTKSNIFINPNDWNPKKNSIKQNVENDTKKEVSAKIETLSKYIYNSFSNDFPKGEVIDSKWLETQVNGYYNKPSSENDTRYYFIPFVAAYIENSKTRVNKDTGKVISHRTIQNYFTTLTRLKDYEHKYGKLRIKDVDLNFHNKFVSLLKIEGNYGGTIIEKYVSQIKGFVKYAKTKGFETSPEIDSKDFSFPRDETIDTYFNEDEIDIIFNLDLKNNQRLDNVRDLFIVGVWTGLRISDLKRINEFNITENRIKIISTEKTGAHVEIPLHSQIKAIILKRQSILPTICSQKFNLYIKELCKLAGFTKEIFGGIKDPKTNRKVKGYYPKYKLISSHTCRRSFVSNHYGQLDDKTIMAISTHKNISVFLDYVKITAEEHANKLEELWKRKDIDKKEKAELKIA
jgi:integrase